MPAGKENETRDDGLWLVEGVAYFVYVWKEYSPLSLLLDCTYTGILALVIEILLALYFLWPSGQCGVCVCVCVRERESKPQTAAERQTGFFRA